jgi:ankyrin repeat protein
VGEDGLPLAGEGAEGHDGSLAPSGASSSAPFFSQSSLDAAFLLSCEGGHIRILYLLLPRISALSISNERGENGLHLSARNGHRDIVELLVKQGCEVEARSIEGHTPLYSAIAASQIHCAAFLLEAIRPRAEVNISDVTARESILHLACRTGYAQLVLLLLRSGAESTVRNARGEAPIDVVKSAEIARVLLEFQAQRQNQIQQQQSIQQQQQATAAVAAAAAELTVWVAV